MSEEDIVVVDPAIEQEARDMGWVPLEEFRSDPAKWRSAEEFVERGREILPILKKNKDELLQKNRELKSQIDEMRSTFDEFKEYRKKDKERAYKEALEDLKRRKVEAIKDNDGDLVVEIDEAISEIKEEAKEIAKQPESKPVEPQIDPIFQEWLSDNEWFKTKPTLQYAANAAGVEVLEEFPSLKGRKFLDKVAERVKERYPEHFGSPRELPNTVESVRGSSVRTSKKKSYENLPADAKVACDRFVKQGLMTREEYVKEYDWSV